MKAKCFPTAVYSGLSFLLVITLLGIGLSGECLAGRAVFLLYDTSRSLSEQDLENALSLGREIVQSSQDSSDLFGVMRFDDSPRLLAPLGSAESALSVLQSMGERSGNFTTLNDALYDALKAIRAAGANLNAIILFTDGNDENSVLLFDDVMREANASRTAIYPVVVGTRTDERTLRRFAKLSGGAFFARHWLNDSNGFATELGRELENRGSALSAQAQAAQPVAVESTQETADQGQQSEALETPPQEGAEAVSGDWSLTTVLILALGALIIVAVVLMLRRGKKEPATTTRAKKTAPVVPKVPLRPPQPTPSAPKDPAVDESLESTVILSNFPTVEIRRGSNAGEIFLLKTEGGSFVGRAKTNHICVQDEAVTSRHCEIRGDGEGFVVLDLNSTNGTFLNDQRVEGPQGLKSGDVLRIGETELVFKYQQHRD